MAGSSGRTLASHRLVEHVEPNELLQVSHPHRAWRPLRALRLLLRLRDRLRLHVRLLLPGSGGALHLL